MSTWKSDPCSVNSNSHSNANSMYLPLITEWGQQWKPFLDGALLWQHAAVCLLALFIMPLKVRMCWLPAQEKKIWTSWKAAQSEQCESVLPLCQMRHPLLTNHTLTFYFFLENKKRYLAISQTNFTGVHECSSHKNALSMYFEVLVDKEKQNCRVGETGMEFLMSVSCLF